MPTITSKSNVRAVSDHCSLLLNIKHHLTAEILGPGMRQFSTKTRLPDGIDVLAPSNVVIALSGMFNGCAVPASDVVTSYATIYLVNFLRMNAIELGLNTVSTANIDPEDDTPKLYLTFSRSLPLKSEVLPVHATLMQLDIQYVWRAPLQSQPGKELHGQSCDHPFAAHLALPFRAILHNVIKRFVAWQLVRRYPLIFGAWCQQLELERQFFPTIFSSIRNIQDRSSNPAFRVECQRLFKAIKWQHRSARRQAMATLSSYSECDSLPTASVDAHPFTDEDSLCLSMEFVYKNGMRKPKFKGSGDTSMVDPPDDDELSQEHPTHIRDAATQIVEDLFWQEHRPEAQDGDSSIAHFATPFSMALLISPGKSAKNLDADSDSDEFEFDERPDNYDLDIESDSDRDPHNLQYWPAGIPDFTDGLAENDAWHFTRSSGDVEESVDGKSCLEQNYNGDLRHCANPAIYVTTNPKTNHTAGCDQSPDQQCSQGKELPTHMANLVSASNLTNPNSPDPPFPTATLDTPSETEKHQISNGYTPEHAAFDQTLLILDDSMDSTDTLGSWCSDDTYVDLTSESDSDIQIAPRHLAFEDEDLEEATDIPHSHPGFTLPSALIDHALQECVGEYGAGEPMVQKRLRGDTLDGGGESVQFELMDFGGDWEPSSRC
ncbi:hypothetical protein BD779DRAFT_1498521 [Infundibulicybe gibba]|nr:hypothetical protein BD779DRAFT_1498521 [Infundibulicybe gibba]